MAGYNLGIISDQEWVGESEGPYAAGDLRDLCGTVGSGVARRGDQPVDRPVFDTKVATDPRETPCVPILTRRGMTVEKLVRSPSSKKK
jgi:hypothetical protein